MLKPLLLAVSLLAVAASAQTPPRPAITGVAFIRLYTTDKPAAQHFYADTLGLQRIDANGHSIYPVNRSQWIELLPAAPPKANVRLAAVGFTTSDAAGLVTYLKAHNVAIAKPLQDGQFVVMDPEGNLVFFVQQGSFKPIADAPKAPHAISDRIIHVGFIVSDRAKEDAFWHGILGFKPYWAGGGTTANPFYVSQQVPDGTDWLEYMLSAKPDSDLKTHGVMDHFSLGVDSMPATLKIVTANGCTETACTASKLGVDGKVQLNLYDPDFTRAEVMEFKPSGPICCSAFAGPHPSEADKNP